MTETQDDGQAGALVQALEWALTLDPVELAAYGAAARERRPGKTARQIAEALVRAESLKVGAATAATGAINNPLIALPAAVAEVGYVLRRQAAMIGRVAAILDLDCVKDEDFQSEIFAVMFGPGLLVQAANAVGVQGLNGAGRALIRKYISKNVLKKLVRFVAKYFGIKLGQKTLLRAVPILGALVGGGVNVYDTRRVGARAIDHFSEAR